MAGGAGLRLCPERPLFSRNGHVAAGAEDRGGRSTVKDPGEGGEPDRASAGTTGGYHPLHRKPVWVDLPRNRGDEPRFLEAPSASGDAGIPVRRGEESTHGVLPRGHPLGRPFFDRADAGDSVGRKASGALPVPVPAILHSLSRTSARCRRGYVP